MTTLQSMFQDLRSSAIILGRNGCSFLFFDITHNSSLVDLIYFGSFVSNIPSSTTLCTLHHFLLHLTID